MSPSMTNPGPVVPAARILPSDCSATADWTACDECECNKNEAGCDKYYTLEDEQCYCGAAAPCLASCTVYCANDDDELDPACDTCDDGLDDTCYDAAATACAADPECNAFLQATTASCNALPDR